MGMIFELKQTNKRFILKFCSPLYLTDELEEFMTHIVKISVIDHVFVPDRLETLNNE